MSLYRSKPPPLARQGVLKRRPCDGTPPPGTRPCVFAQAVAKWKRNQSRKTPDIHPDSFVNVVARYIAGKSTPLDRSTKIVRSMEALHRKALNRRGRRES